MTDFYLFPWDFLPEHSVNTMLSLDVEIAISCLINRTSWFDLTGDPSAVLSLVVPCDLPEFADRLMF